MGRVMTTKTLCDCGHEAFSEGLGTGYARTQDGRTLCYDCADEAQREDMRTADTFTAYLSTMNRSVTTWSGGVLGTVTEYHVSRAARKCYVRVTDVHGAHWYGVGPSESGTYVTLRRSKS